MPLLVERCPRTAWILHAGVLGAAAVCLSAAVSGAQQAVPVAAAPVIAGEERIVELLAHRRSGALSWWLDNGVRCAHLPMTHRAGQAMVSVLLCGGETLEDGRTRGMTALAAVALDRPAGRIVEPDMLDELMAGRDVHLQVSAAPDGLALRIFGSVEDLNAGMQAAGVLLSQPLITDAGLARARAELDRLRPRDARAQSGKPDFDLSDRVFLALAAADDPRLSPPDPASLASATTRGVQAWVDHLVSTAPIEAAFVGDLDRSRAMALSTAFLSGLSARCRPEHARRAAFRVGPAVRADAQLVLENIPLPVNPPERAPGADARAVPVCVGMIGPDLERTADLRALRVAMIIAGDRASPAIPDVPMGHVATPSSGVTDFGVVMVCGVCPPELSPEAAGVLAAELEALTADGPADDELARAVEPLAVTVDGYERDPRYISALLCRIGWRGVDPDQALGGADFYRALRTEDVRDVLRRYNTPSGRFTAAPAR